MTVTNTNAAELDETQLDQVVGAGGLIVDRSGRNAVADNSDVVVHERSATADTSNIVIHERSGK